MHLIRNDDSSQLLHQADLFFPVDGPECQRKAEGSHEKRKEEPPALSQDLKHQYRQIEVIRLEPGNLPGHPCHSMLCRLLPYEKPDGHPVSLEVGEKRRLEGRDEKPAGAWAAAERLENGGAVRGSERFGFQLKVEKGPRGREPSMASSGAGLARPGSKPSSAGAGGSWTITYSPCGDFLQVALNAVRLCIEGSAEGFQRVFPMNGVQAAVGQDQRSSRGTALTFRGGLGPRQ